MPPLAWGIVLATMLIGSATGAQEAGDAAAQANNPLTAFKLLGGDWLMSTSLPLNSYPTPPDSGMETGLGDINAFSRTIPTTSPSGSASGRSSPKARPSSTCS